MSNSFEELVKTLSENQKLELLATLLKSLINKDSQEDTQLRERIETLEKRLASLEEKYEALIKLLAEISILKEQMRSLENAVAKLIAEQRSSKTNDLTYQETPSQTTLETKTTEVNEPAKTIEPKEPKKPEEPEPAQATNTTQQAREVSNVLAHDLWKSIGFNERFAFIRELFQGNADEFTNLINTLNSISEIKEARQLLKSTHSQYNWDEADEDVVEMFYEIVETKFGSSLR
ncbi:MAG: hypothetical protein GXO48_05640 [Chlorobi bacterium]|nr:hypothetical protein [Chlorobiota bacterium]